MQPLACLRVEFPCAGRQGMAAGVCKKRADVAPELGNVFADAADEILEFAVFGEW